MKLWHVALNHPDLLWFIQTCFYSKTKSELGGMLRQTSVFSSGFLFRFSPTNRWFPPVTDCLDGPNQQHEPETRWGASGLIVSPLWNHPFFQQKRPNEKSPWVCVGLPPMVSRSLPLAGAFSLRIKDYPPFPGALCRVSAWKWIGWLCRILLDLQVMVSMIHDESGAFWKFRLVNIWMIYMKMHDFQLYIVLPCQRIIAH